MPTYWEEPLKGIKKRVLDTGFTHLRIHYTADKEKDNDWANRFSLYFGGRDSPRWRREMEIDYRAAAGQRIWPMLDEKLHNAQIDVSGLTKFRIIDQGIRHPTTCIWVAVNAQGDRHVYREYYATDRSIAMNCRAIISLSKGEKIQGTYIDPSTKKRSNETLKPLISVYEENGIFCTPADNSFAGYDRVASAVLSTLARYSIRTGKLNKWLADINPDVDQLTKLAEHPALIFDLRFTSRCFQECYNHRWKEATGDLSQKAEPEKPVDKDDEGPDCVRYAMMSPLFYVPQEQGGFRKITIAEFWKKRDELRKQKEADIKYAKRAYC